jgi:hypothetical protein
LDVDSTRLPRSIAVAKYLDSVFNLVVDSSPQELIAGVLIALAIALVTSAGFAVGRRKVADPQVLQCLLVLVASLLSMTIAGGYVLHHEKRLIAGPPDRPFHGHFALPHSPEVSRGLAKIIFVSADTNKDDRLSPEEAASAAETFVQTIDKGGEGSIGLYMLADAIRFLPGPHPMEQVATTAPTTVRADPR